MTGRVRYSGVQDGWARHSAGWQACTTPRVWRTWVGSVSLLLPRRHHVSRTHLIRWPHVRSLWNIVMCLSVMCCRWKTIHTTQWRRLYCSSRCCFCRCWHWVVRERACVTAACRLMEGGADTGFHHVEPEKYTPRLMHFSGTGVNVVVKQVWSLPMLARGIAIVTCPSVCHEPVLCQNEES